MPAAKVALHSQGVVPATVDLGRAKARSEKLEDTLADLTDEIAAGEEELKRLTAIHDLLDEAHRNRKYRGGAGAGAPAAAAGAGAPAAAAGAAAAAAGAGAGGSRAGASGSGAGASGSGAADA